MKKTVKVLIIALCLTVLSLSTLLFASCKCEHEWSEWQIVTAATCESEGVESRKCSKCDNTEIKKIDALGHEEVTDEEIAATCTTTGKTEGKHCSRCRKVLVQQQDIPALGHDFVIIFITTTQHAWKTELRPQNAVVAPKPIRLRQKTPPSDMKK